MQRKERYQGQKLLIHALCRMAVSMKKTALILISSLLCSALILGGCQMGGEPQAGQSESDISSGSGLPAYTYTYNPYALPSLAEERLGRSLSVYKAAVDAVEERAETVSVGSEEEFELVKGLLEDYYPPFALVTDAQYSAADSSAKFTYRYNDRVHEQKMATYPQLLEGILKLALKEGDSDTTKAMALYLYATSSMFESGRSGLTAWDALNGESDHNGYAEALGALLLQAGVDCLEAEIEMGDGTPHLMVLVKLNGQYYYLDPYGEKELSDGTGLAAFGMTQKDCVEYGYLDAFAVKLGNGSGEVPPAAEDSRFSELRRCVRWEFDEKRENILATVDGVQLDWGPLEKTD